LLLGQNPEMAIAYAGKINREDIELGLDPWERIASHITAAVEPEMRYRVMARQRLGGE